MTDSKLWITYAWVNNRDGDFDYLAQELEAIGVKTSYDKIALTTGRRLWDQIAKNINSPEIKAWAYLVTPESLASQPCREELEYAINRALKEKENEFPLIGIIHGVAFSDLPPALQVRLCVSLDSPNWKEEIRSGLTGKPPKQARQDLSHYIWKMHISSNQTSGTFEIRPRFGNISPWIIAIPKDGPQPFNWGTGPADSQKIYSTQSGVSMGELDLEDGTYSFFSSESPINSSTSAYLEFGKIPPSLIRFGLITQTGYTFKLAVNFTF